MTLDGPPRSVVIECKRRCGTRFVREVRDRESDRDARRRAAYDASLAGWRQKRHGIGEKLMVTSLHESLDALFALAPKCDVCNEHVATTGDSAARRCDRDACNEELVCDGCKVVNSPHCSRCAYCASTVDREVRRLLDLPYADTLRAANAAYEAKR